MQSVKFTAQNMLEKEFVFILRKRVNNHFKENNLSTKANVAMVLKTVVLMNLYLIPFLLILVMDLNVLTGFLLSALMGLGIAGVGMSVMHDACHGAYSKKEWVNNLLSGTLYLLGSNVLNWKIQHNVLHHSYTNISGLDEDINDKGPIRLSKNTPLKKYHKYQFLYAFVFYGLMTLFKLFNDFTGLHRYDRSGLIKGQNKNLKIEFSKMLLRKIIYTVVIFGLPLWLTDFTFFQILIGFITMHWVASIVLSFIFQMAHVVEGASQSELTESIPTEWSVHQLNTTADFARSNKLLSWYVGGLNFQIEHHLFPHICHIHYKNIAPIVEQTAVEFGIKYNLQPSFQSALLSHIKRLHEFGRA